jgi:hypothetical protein
MEPRIYAIQGQPPQPLMMLWTAPTASIASFQNLRLLRSVDRLLMASKSPTEVTPDRTAIPPIAEVQRAMVSFRLLDP